MAEVITLHQALAATNDTTLFNRATGGVFLLGGIVLLFGIFLLVVILLGLARRRRERARERKTRRTGPLTDAWAEAGRRMQSEKPPRGSR